MTAGLSTNAGDTTNDNFSFSLDYLANNNGITGPRDSSNLMVSPAPFRYSLEECERFMESTRPAYHYHDICENEIRILFLEKRTFDQDITCSLQTITLPEPGEHLWRAEYVTLSYAWGETYPDGSHLKHTVICNGCSIKVTSSLYKGLLRLRQRFDCQFGFWIDQICVNQFNYEERARQVALMKHIYANSSALIVWLGEIYPDVPELIPKTGWTLRSWLNENPTKSGLVQFPWFRRRWVVQEYGLTTSNRWFLISGALFYDFTILNTFSCRGLMHLAGPIQSEKYTVHSQQSIMKLLDTYHGCECSDDRDRIFALLSLAEDGAAFYVDYTQSVEVSYRNLAIYVSKLRSHPTDLQATDIIYLLAAATARRSAKFQARPSWVPDWRRPYDKCGQAVENAAAIYNDKYRALRRWLWPNTIKAHYDLEDKLHIVGILLTPCFPPSHEHDCATCKIFALVWNFYSAEVREMLSSLNSGGYSLMLFHPVTPVFILRVVASTCTAPIFPNRLLQCFDLFGDKQSYGMDPLQKDEPREDGNGILETIRSFLLNVMENECEWEEIIIE